MNSMNSMNKKKVYRLSSDNNNYILCFSSFDENDMKKLNIRITHNGMNFNTIKTLEEIKNENKCLFKYNTINSLIDYLSILTKGDCLAIEKRNTFLYNLTFCENLNNKNENNLMRFDLKREIDLNEKGIKIMEEEIISIYNQLEDIKTSFEIKIEDLKKDYETKIKTLESRFDNKNYEFIKNKNDNQIFDEKIDVKSSLIEKNCVNKSKIVDYSLDYDDIDNNNKSYNNNNHNINKARSIINSNNANNKNDINKFKENNNGISFRVEPIKIKEKIIINNEKEECDIFTAFDLPTNVSIIAWTIKTKENNPHSIYIKNMNTKKETHREAHKNLINCLQYFHNENIQENDENNFIISLSKNDIQPLKIWKIEDQIELNCVKSLSLTNHKIDCFCTFNNKNYSQQDNYFIFSGNNDDYDNNNNIKYFSLNDNFNNNFSIHTIENYNKVNYLDTYYSEERKQLYLINCNERNVNVIINPFNNIINKCFNYKQSFSHGSGFIVERNNIIELFESNIYGVVIWDIDNNQVPIFLFEFKYTIYDMCLWNEQYFCISSASGFHFIYREKDKGERKISFGNENSSKQKKSSKVRKIFPSEESKSIVGINNNKKLCLWPIEGKDIY